MICNMRISDDTGRILAFNGFYLKKWLSYNLEHTISLNETLRKPTRDTDYLRVRPDLSDTRAEMQIMLKSKSSDETEVMETESSISQLGRTLTRFNYSVKTKIASFMRKKEKIIFSCSDDCNTYLECNDISKRELCSLLHCFFDMMNTILAQTVLFARYTWYILHRLGVTTDWDETIPPNIKKMAALSVYAFFFESQNAMMTH